MTTLTLAWIAIALALFFNFSNGFHDAANIVAAIVSSRAMRVRSALIMTAVFVFIGSYFLGTAIAETIGGGILFPQHICIDVVLAAMAAAVIWNLVTWWLGLPSSSSHALIGGLMGAALVSGGPEAVQWSKLLLVILVIFAAPLLGLGASFLCTRLNIELLATVRPGRAGKLLNVLQVISGALLALAHGTNDAQKAMGLIVLSLMLLYPLDPTAIGRFYTPDAAGAFIVPHWVILTSAAAMSLGMLSGGERIIKTVGLKLFKIRPIHGFSAQVSSACVVYACSLLGFPVSTTHVAASGIMGAGAAQRLSKVRWGVAGEIMMAWLVTIPAACLLAMLLTPLCSRLV